MLFDKWDYATLTSNIICFTLLAFWTERSLCFSIFSPSIIDKHFTIQLKTSSLSTTLLFFASLPESQGQCDRDSDHVQMFQSMHSKQRSIQNNVVIGRQICERSELPLQTVVWKYDHAMKKFLALDRLHVVCGSWIFELDKHANNYVPQINQSL